MPGRAGAPKSMISPLMDEPMTLTGTPCRLAESMTQARVANGATTAVAGTMNCVSLKVRATATVDSARALAVPLPLSPLSSATGLSIAPTPASESGLPSSGRLTPVGMPLMISSEPPNAEALSRVRRSSIDAAPESPFKLNDASEEPLVKTGSPSAGAAAPTDSATSEIAPSGAALTVTQPGSKHATSRQFSTPIIRAYVRTDDTSRDPSRTAEPTPSPATVKTDRTSDTRAVSPAHTDR